MNSANQDVKFAGTIPANYARYLVPVIFTPYAADLAERITGVLRKGRLLEIACGTGVVTRSLDSVLPADVRITATDLNEGMLETARQSGSTSTRVEWRQADVTALPFEPGAFDAVACQFGLMFVPDKGLAFREMRRVLRDGGALMFSVWCGIEENPLAIVTHGTITRFFGGVEPAFYRLPFSFHDAALISELLATSGFVDVKTERVEFVAEAKSVADFARGLVEGNPIVHAIHDAGLSIPPIIDAVAKGLKEVGGDAPFRAPMRALVVTARAGGVRR